MPAPELDMLDASDILLWVTSTPNDTVNFDDSGCAPDTSIESSQPSESHILKSIHVVKLPGGHMIPFLDLRSLPLLEAILTLTIKTWRKD